MSGIEITKEQLDNLMKLAGLDERVQNADSNTISKALIEIERKLNYFSYPLSFSDVSNLHILIADDMELSIYQLTSMLRKIGAEVCVSRSKEEAIAEIKKKHFDYVILDLFLPDFEDGFELLKFVNEYKKNKNNDVKVLVMSGTDDNDTVQKCYSEGIDEFISKQPDWHKQVMKFISDTVVKASADEYKKYYINDNICVLNIHKINNENYINNIIKEVNANVLTGKVNIIFDMENVKVFSDKYAAIFAQVFKAANQAGGQFVIVKPSRDILDALKFVFLNNAIKTFYSIEEAVKDIEENVIE